MDYAEAALKMHRENHGKLEMASKIPLTTRDELSTAYTPGVAAPCLKIKEDKSEAYTYTAKGNLVDRGDGRNRCAGTGRYRPGGSHAGHGGKSRPL